MQQKNLKIYTEQIQKTGFLLEYKVTNILEKHDWTVINNRYYVDDVTQTSREIDILAYKTEKTKGVIFYTVLLISCKKSEKNLWAFLTRKLDSENPNINLYPVLNWTNNRYLKYFLTNTKWIEKFEDEISFVDYLENIYSIDKQVFAFQEMNKESGIVQNDRAIFDSISGLIKATAFEIDSLDKRKKEETFYNFNLISVVDTEFLELFFDEKNITPCEITNIKYLNRFIVYGKDNFYKIDFIDYKNFEPFLDNYNKLNEWNERFYSSKIDLFFENILNDKNKIEYQTEMAYKNLLPKLNSYLLILGNEKIEKITFEYYMKELRIVTNLTDDVIDRLNRHTGAKKYTLEFLKTYFRYSGDFEYSIELPF
jgi:hypothetical protein